MTINNKQADIQGRLTRCYLKYDAFVPLMEVFLVPLLTTLVRSQYNEVFVLSHLSTDLRRHVPLRCGPVSIRFQTPYVTIIFITNIEYIGPYNVMLITCHQAQPWAQMLPERKMSKHELIIKINLHVFKSWLFSVFEALGSVHASHFCRVEFNSIRSGRNATVDSYDALVSLLIYN